MPSKTTRTASFFLLSFLLAGSAFATGSTKPHGDPGPTPSHSQGQTQKQGQEQEQAQSQRAEAEAEASARAAASSRSGASIVTGDTVVEASDYPVESAAVLYAAQCVNVGNVQTSRIGIGVGSQDRNCQWLNLAQARQNAAAALTCTLPDLGKGGASTFDVEAYKVCTQRKSLLWHEADSYLVQAKNEMCSRGVLKRGWDFLWSGNPGCAKSQPIE